MMHKIKRPSKLSTRYIIGFLSIIVGLIISMGVAMAIQPYGLYGRGELVLVPPISLAAGAIIGTLGVAIYIVGLFIMPGQSEIDKATKH